ncbi:hypothetical protein BDN72DRAFT_892949 [Pluteus cervinus]|uniref:Uncharacterized protein n=1 Tax=Pluteus cervinus TaxID=181527 RepID=A0ACD3B977_9AGAR|nr:hypothetical protein BDN72DRAFT_892949 [Pluteus cervinus]
MTRGRKKDLTIPPTRALVQQRDYRARKAQYVSELEERVRRAEEENAQLRKDLACARAGLAVPATVFNPEMAQSSAELMHNLSLASASLARFQQIAFSVNGQSTSVIKSALTPSSSTGTPPPTLPPINANTLRPTSFPSPAPSSAYSDSAHTPTSHTITDYSSRPHHPPPRPDSPPGKRYFRSDSPPSRASPRALSRSPSVDSEGECYARPMDYRDREESTGGSGSFPRISVLRSTSDDDIDDPAAQFYSRPTIPMALLLYTHLFMSGARAIIYAVA